ncbi:MAG: virulence RhuM family protein [Paludibacteraceae bacterium]|nr:virulence RhuM family protein [Paludibacteraceae bacterium]
MKNQNLDQNQIILYSPNESISLEVRLENETVWLNRQQIAQLFGRDIKTIGKHINNALREELSNCSVVANFATTATDGKTYNVEYYNIEVITSVGYRVKSKQGVQFRQWANKVLKDYLLRGYAVNQRIDSLENKIDNKLYEHEQKIEHLTEQVDFFVRTSLPPVEGVFHNNQVFDAHILMSDLVKQAKVRIIVIDNYVDDSVLTLLTKRKKGVTAEIYTYKKSEQFTLDLDKHNLQYPSVTVHVNKTCHDRFMIVDDKVYHIGASIKDLGQKLCAVTLLNSITAEDILNKLK